MSLKKPPKLKIKKDDDILINMKKGISLDDASYLKEKKLG